MKLLSLILSFNILIASTGMTLYTNICSVSDQHSISIMEMNCDKQEEKMSCCTKAESCQIEDSEDGCCESSGTFYKSDITALLSGKSDFESEQHAVIVPYIVLPEFIRTNMITSTTAKAPLPPGSDPGISLPELQVFRC